MSHAPRSRSVAIFFLGATLVLSCQRHGPAPNEPRDPGAAARAGAAGEPSGTPPPESDRTTLLGPDNFTYLGAFRLPREFAWGARGMTYYPEGDSGAGTLLITGFDLPRNRRGGECRGRRDCFAFYGEVRIPQPVDTDRYEAAPLARLVGPMRPFDEGLSATVDPGTTWVADIAYVPRRGSQRSDKIYGSLVLWYAEGTVGDSTFDTIWFANLDGTGAQGLFHVGPEQSPFHGRKMGEYLFTVPQWYADQYLDGRILVTGRARGTPLGDDPVAGGSQGPTLFAFAAFDTDEASGDLDAVPLLYYRSFYPGCAGDNVGDPANCDYPDYTMCDVWQGGAFVEAGSHRAIMLLGYKGLGENCYDHPPIDCEDPCSDDHGYHCNPYERQVIFYDVDQLGAVAQGETDPWEVVPYAIWRPEGFFIDGHTCSEPGGMAFDRENQRLFMVERGMGSPSENLAAVHVWSVSE